MLQCQLLAQVQLLQLLDELGTECSDSMQPGLAFLALPDGTSAVVTALHARAILAAVKLVSFSVLRGAKWSGYTLFLCTVYMFEINFSL
jgi:hypothetical protein